MLEVKDLKKEFITAEGKVLAVDGVSFSIQKGSFVAIIGKSGSGKSTLLSLLGALDRPSGGSIRVDEREITKLPDRQLIKYRRDKIGFIFQNYNLIPNLTALENVMLPMEFAGMAWNSRFQRAQELLNEVGIFEGKQKRLPLRLSGGEQQRVSIARALANKPSLILADEPTGNLDSNTSKNIVELLKNLSKRENTTIIVVTHDLNITNHVDLTFQLMDGKLTTKSNQYE